MGGSGVRSAAGSGPSGPDSTTWGGYVATCPAPVVSAEMAVWQDATPQNDGLSTPLSTYQNVPPP